jgi:hypothetical protein
MKKFVVYSMAFVIGTITLAMIIFELTLGWCSLTQGHFVVAGLGFFLAFAVIIAALFGMLFPKR